MTIEEMGGHLLAVLSEREVDSYYRKLFELGDDAEEQLRRDVPGDIRQEAANIAGVDVASLPSEKLITGSVRWLFSLLVDDLAPYAMDQRELDPDGMTLTTTRLVDATQLYDDRIELEAIRDSMEVVGVRFGGAITQREFYHWVVCMFCDCNEEEFVSGVEAFAEAARALKEGRAGGGSDEEEEGEYRYFSVPNPVQNPTPVIYSSV